MENEIWKDIPEFENRYQASNLGNVRSVLFGKVKILKQYVNENGYYFVCLYTNGKGKQLRVNRLVWMTFNGKIPDGMEVNHNNEDKSDNSLLNLSLMSHIDNSNWGSRNERISKTMTNGVTSKAVIQYSLNGEHITEYPSIAEVNRQTNYDISLIQKCCSKHRHNKTAYGYIWKYKN